MNYCVAGNRRDEFAIREQRMSAASGFGLLQIR